MPSETSSNNNTIKKDINENFLTRNQAVSNSNVMSDGAISNGSGHMMTVDENCNDQQFTMNGFSPYANRKGLNLAEFGVSGFGKHGGVSRVAERKVSVNGVFLATSNLDYQLEKQIFPAEPEVPLKLIRTQEEEWEPLEASEHSKNTVNPIRKIVDYMTVSPNPAKELLKLHLGDPTVTGFLPMDPSVLQALQSSLLSGKYNGYGPCTGIPEARQALVDAFHTPDAPFTSDDVILTSGCSHSLQLAIEALGNPGDNILVPRPGFPLYSTLMRPHGITDKHYNLQMDNNWEVDLGHLESLIDCRTKAILVNNPSNPCGAVYSKRHLKQILKVAEKHKIPIISDEIYGDLTYDGAKFFPLAELSPKIPILTCDGISKRWLVPGWRLGWLIVHDRFGALSHIRDAIKQLATKIVGPCVLIQGALPTILKDTPEEFFAKTRSFIEKNARAALEELEGTPGLKPVKPQGAMYMMVGMDVSLFPQLETEMDFIKGLIKEESVYCLPGRAFNFSGAFRLVLTYNEEKTREACKRIKSFCARYFEPSPEQMNGLSRSKCN